MPATGLLVDGTFFLARYRKVRGERREHIDGVPSVCPRPS